MYLQHYGMIFNYRTIMLDYTTEVPPIPASLDYLHQRIRNAVAPNCAGLASTENEPLPFTQLTINEYLPGQGIASHIGKVALSIQW